MNDSLEWKHKCAVAANLCTTLGLDATDLREASEPSFAFVALTPLMIQMDGARLVLHKMGSTPLSQAVRTIAAAAASAQNALQAAWRACEQAEGMDPDLDEAQIVCMLND